MKKPTLAVGFFIVWLLRAPFGNAGYTTFSPKLTSNLIDWLL